MRLPEWNSWPWAFVAGALLACGGGSSSAPVAEPVPESTGSGAEQTEPLAAEPAPADEPAPIKAGPATVQVEAKVRGEAAAADVRVIAADGSEAATGRTGEPITVQSGEYTLHVAITDEAVLFDKPMKRVPLTVQAGDSLRETVDFPWAMIQLNVRVNGRPDSGAVVEVKRQGAVIGTLKSGAAHVPISPGRYDAEVKTRNAKIPVQGLMFQESATQSVPVNVQL